ncbi:MAG: PhoPQ-activated pathogenicity-related family protein, partial [Pirellulales bacterium]
LALFLLAACAQSSRAQTALDAYIAKPDASYGYSLVRTVSGSGYTGYVLDMTSQTWRDPTEITNRTEWQHYVSITKPDVLRSNTAILFISGGSNGLAAPTGVNASIALATGAVTVELQTVPNQPLQFAGESFGRSEDAIIAKTFRKFLDGGDDEWPLLLPMTKSAVRAMDTAQDYLAGQGVAIDDFFVTGASKRGWTTWLTAAVDERVSAIAPLVIDVLNIDEQMAHHRRVYEETTERIVGGYAEAIADYVAEDVLGNLESPRGQELLASVDPYEYRDRLDMPKYLVHSTGDQFFVPDSSQLYFGDLIGPTYQRYVPNTDHGLNAGAVFGVLNFYTAVTQDAVLPEFSWTIAGDGASIAVDTVDAPESVRLWQATNPEGRDFRRDTFGAGWTSSTLDEVGDGQYLAEVTVPPTGATAFMVELVYDVAGNPITFTTDISVVQVPEPGTCVLALLAAVAAFPAAAWRCRRGAP